MKTLVAFSHLRWDFVYQRPQHLLTRMAKHFRVLFVEEPVCDAVVPWLERIDAAPGVTVLRVHATTVEPGFDDAHVGAMKRMLAPVLAASPGAVAWLYTPMALPLLSGLDTSAIVYDCMDELRCFHGAPTQLSEREHALLERADLVFAGGPSLFHAKRALHPAVYCFPSSVDAGHFDDPARRGEPHSLQRDIARPRLGFFGVIDERFDGALVDAVAAACPAWQIVLVGPIVKVDPATLPRRANIHYLGLQPYAALPALIAGWDVSLLPFAHNASTRFISPTKVLEYMAAGKPIVSTSIRDIVEPYGHVVSIADHPSDFIEACCAALNESADRREQREADMRRVVASTSWDRTAAAMQALIAAVVHGDGDRMHARDGANEPDITGTLPHRASTEGRRDASR